MYLRSNTAIKVFPEPIERITPRLIMCVFPLTTNQYQELQLYFVPLLFQKALTGILWGQ